MSSDGTRYVLMKEKGWNYDTCIKFIKEKRPSVRPNSGFVNQLKEYYKVEELTLENIAKSRNWIVSGSEPDIERTATFILKYFRDGKLGKFILDEIES